MPTIRRIRAGHKSRREGEHFESLITIQARKEKMVLIRIPNGCRPGYGKLLIRVKTPFDFVLLYREKAIVFDAKSLDSKTFPKSAIVGHQLQSLLECEREAAGAGYLIHYREPDIISFHYATQLLMLSKQSSIKPEDGVILGTSKHWSMFPLYDSPEMPVKIPVNGTHN